MPKSITDHRLANRCKDNDKQVGAMLIEWFKDFGDYYPFRAAKDPYKILVSELMLRKTTARQVSSVYCEFIARFPDAAHLSEGSIEEIQNIIKPLGIRGRAHDLKRIAEIVVRNGTVPNEFNELDAIKGVGKYIAGCVLVFAYGMRYPLVDTNVERVFGRAFQSRIVSGRDPATDMMEIYSEISPAGLERQFHYAIIDLAHKVCKRKEPLCDSCPIKQHCDYAQGWVETCNRYLPLRGS